MKIEIFKNNFGAVRVIQDEKGEPWFVLSDVCKILELSNPTMVAQSLDVDDLSSIEVIDNIGRKQKANAVNESGLYQVIFQSRKPEAKQFKRWVTSEVLPTIRKTGGYVSKDDLFIDTYLRFADEKTKIMFKQTLQTIRIQNEELSRKEKEIQSMKPKVEYFDDLVDRKLLTNFRDTAKELKIKQKDFVEFLIQNRFIYRDSKGQLKPYSQYTPELFEIKEWANPHKAGTQTLITPKGRETFRILLKKKSA